MAPMTAAVMNAVGPQRAGLGSATTNTSREVGGLFGIALLGTILTTRLESAFLPAIEGLGLSPDRVAAIGEAAGHGQVDPALLQGIPGEQQAAIAQAFSTAFMDGFHVALVIGGVVLLLGAVVANRFIPGRETIEQHHADAEALAVA
jgi:hypothetical protein